MKQLMIAPSLLSADFAKLADEVRDVELGGADLLHIDVMDGHFVPNLTFGPLIVEAIRAHTSLPLDVHLMTEKPELFISSFAKAGADNITVHAEASVHLHRTLHDIKEHGVRAGVAINPATPVRFIEPIIEDVDLVLIMTVNPGFGGQTFIPSTLRKIAELRQLLNERGLTEVHIEVDGGINKQTASAVAEAGANILVAGHAVFAESDRKQAIESIRGIALSN